MMARFAYRLLIPLAAMILLPWAAQAKELAKVDFASEIQPVIESACLRCHNEQTAESNLRLESLKLAIEGGDRGAAIVPGKPDESPLFTMLELAEDDDEVMPPSGGGGGKLSKLQIDRFRTWISSGATWPDNAKLTVRPRILFAKHVQPILEQNCLACHNTEDAQGDLDLSHAEVAFNSSGSGDTIVPFDPADSLLYASTIADKDADELMPPSNAGGALENKDTEKLRLWISQGATWPADLRLVKKAKRIGNYPTTDDFTLLKKIHAKLVATAKEESSEHADYASKIPLTKVPFEMVAVKAGSFKMGSPDSEPHRSDAEGPQTEVTVEAFWIGKHEVTWDEYEPFMVTQADRYKNGSRINFDQAKHTMVDAVSQPTPPYKEMSFGMGQKGFPAISMTQHAANKYCQWLSAQTGHFYRLPTEAEWEYACRAGTTTAYSFGDDASKIGDYAWYYENSNEKYQKVGKKKPNPWGIHDMHGNVMEWTADAYDAKYFDLIKGNENNPFLQPEKLYPRTARGGHWDDDSENLRSAVRRGSDASWKIQDPQLPKSVWYHTNATWLGFRIVRPAKTPTVEEMNFYWNSATGKTR